MYSKLVPLMFFIKHKHLLKKSFNAYNPTTHINNLPIHKNITHKPLFINNIDERHLMHIIV